MILGYTFWSLFPLILTIGSGVTIALVTDVVRHRQRRRLQSQLESESVEHQLFGSDTSSATERLEKEVLPAMGAPSIIELVQKTESDFDEAQKPKPKPVVTKTQTVMERVSHAERLLNEQIGHARHLGTVEPSWVSAVDPGSMRSMRAVLCCHGHDPHDCRAFPCPNMRSYGMDPSSMMDYGHFKDSWSPEVWEEFRHPRTIHTTIMAEDSAEPVAYLDRDGRSIPIPPKPKLPKGL